MPDLSVLHCEEFEHLRFTCESVLFIELLEGAHELYLVVDDVYDAVLVHARFDPAVFVRLMQTIQHGGFPEHLLL